MKAIRDTLFYKYDRNVVTFFMPIPRQAAIRREISTPCFRPPSRRLWHFAYCWFVKGPESRWDRMPGSTCRRSIR